MNTQKKGDSPPEHFDFVLQRVLLAFQGFFVDDFDGVHCTRLILALGQSHLGECSSETANNNLLSKFSQNLYLKNKDSGILVIVLQNVQKRHFKINNPIYFGLYVTSLMFDKVLRNYFNRFSFFILSLD